MAVENFIGIKEAAAFLGCKPRTVLNQIDDARAGFTHSVLSGWAGVFTYIP